MSSRTTRVRILELLKIYRVQKMPYLSELKILLLARCGNLKNGLPSREWSTSLHGGSELRGWSTLALVT
ncbi:hypothetical protein TNCV_3774321 [Trichonephila clavipes]|nr:hypothetical protein TNCV_3774321 [Trichonephila clavipes]